MSTPNDFAVLAMLQSFLGGSTSKEQPLLLNEMARRLILSGLSINASGVINVSIPFLGFSSMSGTPNQLAAFDGSGNGISTLLTNAHVDPAAAIAYSKLNLTGGVVNADIGAAAAIGWTKVSKTGSSLADLTTRSAADLSTGLLPDARLSTNVPLINGTNAFSGTNSFAGFPLDLIGGQLKFPAAQNASANANTLDDYEEGGWTPTDTSGAGLVFTGVSGSYVKIGQMVFACANLIYPVTVSAAPTAVGGLPFASQAAVPYFGCTINYTSVGVGFTILQIISGTSLAMFALDGTAMLNSTWSAKELRFTAIYRAGA